MFAKLLRQFTDNAPERAEITEPVALATLLVRAARADNHFSDEERATIASLLNERYGDDSAIVEAEKLEAEIGDIMRVTEQLKKDISFETRAEVLEALWRVILSDGTRDDSENALARLTTGLLGLADRESAFARKRAEKKLGLIS